MILKIKAFIYRLTGLYLAQKEEDAYMALDSTKDEVYETWMHYSDITYSIAESITIGTWQADHGFVRRWRI